MVVVVVSARLQSPVRDTLDTRQQQPASPCVTQWPPCRQIIYMHVGRWRRNSWTALPSMAVQTALLDRRNAEHPIAWSATKRDDVTLPRFRELCAFIFLDLSLLSLLHFVPTST